MNTGQKKQLSKSLKQIAIQFQRGEITLYEMSQQVINAGKSFERIYYSKQMNKDLNSVPAWGKLYERQKEIDKGI
jgi:hypothetical protein